MYRTRYYRHRLWKVTHGCNWIGGGIWRYVKFYERRTNIGCAWRLVHHAAYETIHRP